MKKRSPFARGKPIANAKRLDKEGTLALARGQDPEPLHHDWEEASSFITEIRKRKERKNITQKGRVAPNVAFIIRTTGPNFVALPFGE